MCIIELVGLVAFGQRNPNPLSIQKCGTISRGANGTGNQKTFQAEN
jgi:hypothetical protein